MEHVIRCGNDHLPILGAVHGHSSNFQRHPCRTESPTPRKLRLRPAHPLTQLPAVSTHWLPMRVPPHLEVALMYTCHGSWPTRAGYPPTMRDWAASEETAGFFWKKLEGSGKFRLGFYLLVRSWWRRWGGRWAPRVVSLLWTVLVSCWCGLYNWVILLSTDLNLELDGPVFSSLDVCVACSWSNLICKEYPCFFDGSFWFFKSSLNYFIKALSFKNFSLLKWVTTVVIESIHFRNFKEHSEDICRSLRKLVTPCALFW